MTKDAIRSEVQSRLGEYFDGYVIVGKVAGANEVVIAAIPGNEECKLNLIIGLCGVLSSKEFQNNPPK